MADKERILLIASDENEIELTTLGLMEAGLANAYDVVHSGDEAFDYLLKRGKFANRTGGYPAVIFLDIKIPGADGREVLRRLKTTEKINCIPVVMFTGSDFERDIVETYVYGANSYIVKPFKAKELFEVIKKAGLYWTVVSEPPMVEKCLLPKAG